MTTFRFDEFPDKLPDPLERLNVYDGLILNAERWEFAQSYMRHRQNCLFQATHQPGIVCGFGVKVISPPTWSRAKTREKDAQLKEQRWLEIQPGVAIDTAGNPIILGKGDERYRTFRVATPAPTSKSLTIYIIARFVEPFQEGALQQVTLPEQCRLEESTHPPGGLEVELCRIRLNSGPVMLKTPGDVHSPQAGELDFRYRQPVRPKPSAIIRLGFLGNVPQSTIDNFQYLKQAIARLAPELQLEVAASPMQLKGTLPLDQFDALYVSEKVFQPLLIQQLRWVESYLHQGGTLLLEIDSGVMPVFPPQIQKIFNQFIRWTDLRMNHPLKTNPFLFTQPAEIEGRTLDIALAEGVIWFGGILSSAWGIERSLQRSDIRTAHELGANLLQYIWQRRHLTQLLQWQID